GKPEALELGRRHFGLRHGPLQHHVEAVGGSLQRVAQSRVCRLRVVTHRRRNPLRADVDHSIADGISEAPPYRRLTAVRQRYRAAFALVEELQAAFDRHAHVIGYRVILFAAIAKFDTSLRQKNQRNVAGLGREMNPFQVVAPVISNWATIAVVVLLLILWAIA